MNTIKKTVAAAAIAASAVTMGAVVASPASAINRASCDGRTDYFTIWNYGYSGELCFANNGSEDVAIYDVNEVDTGNNQGYYDIAGDEVYQNTYVDAEYSSSSASGLEVTWIDITGR